MILNLIAILSDFFSFFFVAKTMSERCIEYFNHTHLIRGTL